VVIAGEARNRLGEVLARAFLRKSPQVGEDGLQKERAKPFRAPLIIAVGVDRPSEPRVQAIENVCAAAAACQNILLAAVELGIAGYWRTGDAVRDPEVRALLGLTPDQELIAFLYLGYPVAPVEPRQRPGFEDRTTWL
jgi:nitroreductase